MKIKRLVNIAMPLLLTFTVVGCSNAAGSEEQTASQTATTATKEANANAASYEKPDVYGEISEIIGNEVTLKLLEIPDMSARSAEQGNRSADKPAGDASASGGTTGTGAPTDGTAGGMRQKNYTGEEKTIVIPVGTPIVSTTRGENGMEETEISMNELASGNTLSIYYGDDGKTIEKITLRKQRTGGGGQGGAGAKSSN